jgi:hypothetical protein
LAATEISRERFKGLTFSVVNPVTSTVGTSATLILRNNPERVMTLIVNQSSYDGYVGFDAQVASDRGILIPSLGGFMILTVEEDGALVTQEVYAISPGGSGTWYIVEVRRK